MNKLSYEEYAIIVEQAPIMIWRSNLTMGCDYFNDIWLNFTGKTLAQEIGNGWVEGVHKDDFQYCVDIYTENFKQEAIFEMEYRLKRYDGVFRWILDRGVPFYQKNIFTGFIGSCIDITSKKEAEETLQKAHLNEIEQLRGVLPICSYCKKIRNDKNYWEQLETYITSHSLALFSHGICPDCLATVQAEL